MGLILAMPVAVGMLIIVAGIAWPMLRRKPKARPLDDIRREWTQARPNWGGSDGWEGRE